MNTYMCNIYRQYKYLTVSRNDIKISLCITLLHLAISADAVTLTGSSEYAVPGTDFTLMCGAPEEANAIRFYRRPNVTNPVGSIQVAGGQCYNTIANPIPCTADVCSCVTSGGNLGTVFRWIIQPQTGDQGSVWFCRRTNLNLPNQTLDSDDYTLNLAAGPVFITLSRPDATYTRTEGDTLPDITCTADCRPNCTFVWTRPNNTNFTVSPVLALGQLDRSAHGMYKCTARNVVGESTITIGVNVQYGPGESTVLVPQQDNVDVMENKTISDVTCSADCRPPCTYTWSKDGTDYPNQLSLSVATRNNAGQYTCTASNTVSQGTKDWNLIVRFPPQIISLSYTVGGADVTENGPKSLICSVESFPPSTIQWFYKTKGTILLTSPDILESTYTLTNAGCLDTGLYTCSVRNSVSTTAVTRDIHINVLCEPRLDQRVRTDYEFKLLTAEALTIRAMFLSNHQPTYTWSFQATQDISIITLANGQENFAINNRFITTNLSAVSVGTRTDIRESWFGVYNVTATNSQGSHTLSFTASAKEKPPDPPDGGKAFCPNADEVILVWISGYNGGSNQTFTVGVRTETQSDVTVDSSIVRSDPGLGKIVTATVAGLKADTKTFFTIYAVNDFGISSGFQEINCKTKAWVREDTYSSTPLAVSLAFNGVFIILIIAGIVIYICRNRQWCRWKCMKQKESQDRQHSEREGIRNDNETRTQYVELDTSNIAKASVYTEIGSSNHVYQNDPRNDAEKGQYESLQARPTPNVYDDLNTQTGTRGTYVNTVIGKKK